MSTDPRRKRSVMLASERDQWIDRLQNELWPDADCEEDETPDAFTPKGRRVVATFLRRFEAEIRCRLLRD
jgi:hypothetical protein